MWIDVCGVYWVDFSRVRRIVDGKMEVFGAVATQGGGENLGIGAGLGIGCAIPGVFIAFGNV